MTVIRASATGGKRQQKAAPSCNASTGPAAMLAASKAHAETTEANQVSNRAPSRTARPRRQRQLRRLASAPVTKHQRHQQCQLPVRRKRLLRSMEPVEGRQLERAGRNELRRVLARLGPKLFRELPKQRSIRGGNHCANGSDATAQVEFGLGACLSNRSSFRPPASALTTVPSNALARRASSIAARKRSSWPVGRMMQPGRDEQTVERELEVGATGRCVADGDSEVLLQRRAGAEPDIVVRPKKRGFPKGSSEAASARAGPSRYSS